MTETEFYTIIILTLVLGVFITLWIKNNTWRFNRCCVCRGSMIFADGNYAHYVDVKKNQEDIAHAKCIIGDKEN